MLRETRETSRLDVEQEELNPLLEKISRPNWKYRTNTRRTSSLQTADVSFRSRLEANFKREFQNVELLFRERPGMGLAALPYSPSQMPGKYLCFLVTKVSEKNLVDPEHVLLTLKRLRDFLVESETKEVSIPVYDPKRGKLKPRELYAILHVVFAETKTTLQLHKNYNLSIA